jgi:hypothetical protein
VQWLQSGNFRLYQVKPWFFCTNNHYLVKYCLNKIPLAMYVKPGVAVSFIVHTKVSKTYLKKKFKDKKKKSIQSFVNSCCRSQCLHIVVRTIQVLFKKKTLLAKRENNFTPSQTAFLSVKSTK